MKQGLTRLSALYHICWALARPPRSKKTSLRGKSADAGARCVFFCQIFFEMTCAFYQSTCMITIEEDRCMCWQKCSPSESVSKEHDGPGANSLKDRIN